MRKMNKVLDLIVESLKSFDGEALETSFKQVKDGVIVETTPLSDDVLLKNSGRRVVHKTTKLVGVNIDEAKSMLLRRLSNYIKFKNVDDNSYIFNNKELINFFAAN